MLRRQRFGSRVIIYLGASKRCLFCCTSSVSPDNVAILAAACCDNGNTLCCMQNFCCISFGSLRRDFTTLFGLLFLLTLRGFALCLFVNRRRCRHGKRWSRCTETSQSKSDRTKRGQCKDTKCHGAIVAHTNVTFHDCNHSQNSARFDSFESPLSQAVIGCSSAQSGASMRHDRHGASATLYSLFC